MCGMTEYGVRAHASIRAPGRYVVSRGNFSQMEMYLRGSKENLQDFKPLYAIRVKPRQGSAYEAQQKAYQEANQQANLQKPDKYEDYRDYNRY